MPSFTKLCELLVFTTIKKLYFSDFGKFHHEIGFLKDVFEEILTLDFTLINRYPTHKNMCNLKNFIPQEF